MDIMEFLGQVEEKKELEIKHRKTTLTDLITILTEFKCLNEILENNNYFYVIMRITKSKNGRSYENIEKILFNREKLESMNLENDPQRKVYSMSVVENLVYPLVRYISYHPELFQAAFKVNLMVGKVSPMKIYKFIEELTPKKKFFITNLGAKVTSDDPIIYRVADYFNCSIERAMSFMETLEECGTDEEFIEFFNYDDKPKEKKRGKKNE